MPELTFLGHSCFQITHDGTRLIIDPFLTGNPVAQAKPESIQTAYVLITHGHGDHWGDAEPIARANDATVVGCFEVAMYAQQKGLKAHPMHVGGGHDFPFGRVQLTIAHHGAGGEASGLAYMGNPAGILLTLGDKVIYHAGDTSLTYDMKLLSEFHSVDLALLPIGDNFTMGIDDAVRATSFVAPRQVVPMHYNTFDLIAADPEEFARKVREQTKAEPVILEVGASLAL